MEASHRIHMNFARPFMGYIFLVLIVPYTFIDGWKLKLMKNLIQNQQ